jgi:ATP-dependent helicase HrpB
MSLEPALARLAPLPIDALLPQLAAQWQAFGAAVVTAEPGAGKTTRVPVDLLQRQAFAGEMWVVQPRRMAALLAARHVAEELGQRCGDQIGYSVRFDEQVSAQTRVRYVTDGLLLRRLVTDPQLRGIGAVVFDEFHERRLAMDVGLAAVRRLRATSRMDLKLLVMSATLEVPALATWLGDVPVLAATGRVYPVDIDYLSTQGAEVGDLVVAGVRRLLTDGLDGDALVFLPGTREIRRCQELLRGLAQQHQLAVVPLHGSLPLREQEQALRPQERRKVLLSTNIAETSLTLPGVVAVIDSGLARVAGYAPWSGLPTLQTQKIAKASATQRAGRAGRVRPGRCLRLYSQFDHDARPGFDKPEIARGELSEMRLQIELLGLDAWDAGQWLTPPDGGALRQAEALLQRLGALDNAGRITALGRELLQWPLHPRLARLVIEAQKQGVGPLGCQVAALLGEREIRSGMPHASRPAHGDSDLWALLEDVAAVQAGESARDRAVDPAGLRQLQLATEQLQRHLGHSRGRGGDVETALSLAVVAGFGDRLARRRQAGAAELEMPGGSRVVLGAQSQVTQAEFAVVLDAEERRDQRGLQTQVRLAHGVDPALLLEALPDRVESTSELLLDRQRVVRVERLLLDGLELDRSQKPAAPGPEVAALLVQTVLARGLQTLVDPEELGHFQSRVKFAREAGGAALLPEIGETAVANALADLAQDCTRLDELADADLLGALHRLVDRSAPNGGLALLEKVAPASMQLPGGRKLRIHYEADRAPWTSSRLQDFFGLADGPRVAQGKVPVVLHLLAPNQRPVQVTTDLAGFWARHYPDLKKELGRRYPRHSWPDNPLTAAPPAPHRIRG